MRSFSFPLLLALLPWLSGAFYAVLAAPPAPDAVPSSRSTPAAPDSNRADLNAYLKAVQKRVKENWQVPEVSTAKRTVASFRIERNGEVSNLTIKESSGDTLVDDRALVAIRQTAPFAPFPATFRGLGIDVQFGFDANVISGRANRGRTVLTGSDFPIKVWINPYFRSSDELAPADAVAALRQGVLDWTRLLRTTPTDDSIQNYAFVLKKRSEEKATQGLMKAGVFVFVTQAKQADLKIEMVPRSQTSDEGGIFTNTEGRIGRIEVAVYGSGGDEREFRLRTVLIHEIGHAFGLDHLPERKCNFMSPMLYTCFSDERQECRTDAPDTRCLSVQLAQIRPIEKLLPARTAKPLLRKRVP